MSGVPTGGDVAKVGVQFTGDATQVEAAASQASAAIGGVSNTAANTTAQMAATTTVVGSNVLDIARKVGVGLRRALILGPIVGIVAASVSSLVGWLFSASDGATKAKEATETYTKALGDLQAISSELSKQDLPANASGRHAKALDEIRKAENLATSELVRQLSEREISRKDFENRTAAIHEQAFEATVLADKRWIKELEKEEIDSVKRINSEQMELIDKRREAETKAAAQALRAWTDAFRRIRDAQVGEFGVGGMDIDVTNMAAALDRMGRQNVQGYVPEFGVNY